MSGSAELLVPPCRLLATSAFGDVEEMEIPTICQRQTTGKPPHLHTFASLIKCQTYGPIASGIWDAAKGHGRAVVGSCALQFARSTALRFKADND